jgi:hypothetical protein
MQTKLKNLHNGTAFFFLGAEEKIFVTLNDKISLEYDQIEGQFYRPKGKRILMSCDLEAVVETVTLETVYQIKPA